MSFKFNLIRMLIFKHLCSVILCIYFTNHIEARLQKTKSVTTLLDAKWKATPLVLEVAEYLADENVDFYWSFIDSISSLKPPLASIVNDKRRYETVLEEASKILSAGKLAVLKLGVSLHIYSPKIEMFAQIASERELPSCVVVADVAGTLTCNLQEMKKKISEFSGKTSARADIYRVDTHFPGSENRSLAVILYGELGTSEFTSFHNVLKVFAQEGTLDYVVRHIVKDRPNRQLRLSGYGVELQMKSTEYKVQDDSEVRGNAEAEESSEEDEDSELEGFHFAKLRSLFPDHKENLEKFKRHLEEMSNEMAPLKVWQFQELSLQAAERIMKVPAEESLKVFTNIAQNFPMQAKSLVNTVVSPELKEEIKKNQDIFASSLNLQPTDTALFINGMFFDLDVVNVYSIVDVIRQELRTTEGLHRLGINSRRLSALLALQFSDSSGSSQEFAMDIRDSAVSWINDIENDVRYSRWSSSVVELIRPMFPGMLRQVRRNFFNLVLVMNPVLPEVRGILKLVESLVVHAAPLRVGLVFAVNPDTALTGFDDPGVAMLCTYNYVSQTKDPASALHFLITILNSVKESEAVTVNSVQAQLEKKFGDDYFDILGEDSDFDFGRRLSDDFIQRSGLGTLPQAMLNGVPLPSSQLNLDEFEEVVLQEVMSQTPVLQRAIYRGKLTDSDDVLEYIMNQPHVMTRLNKRVLNKDSFLHLELSGKPGYILDVQNLAKLSPRDMTATAIENLKYFSIPRKAGGYHSVTYWVVGDLSCSKSRKLLLAALEHLKASGDVRVTFLPNVNGASNKNLLNKLVLAALQALPPEKVTNYVLSLLRDDKAASLLEKGEELDIPAQITPYIEPQELSLKMLRIYGQRVLSFKAGDRAVIANGRILGPLNEDEEFNADDFSLVERFSYSSYGETIKTALFNNSDDDEDLSSNDYMRVVSLLTSNPQTRARFEIAFSGDQYSVLKLPAARPDQAVFSIDAVVDPVSRGAQKLGPLLQVLREVLNCNIRVFLNSVEKSSDMPVKSFYRFVLESEVAFEENGQQSSGPVAKFTNMPASPLLTQNMHVPENWLVEVVRSVYDLDNIRLENVDTNVHSEYELEYLLMEGHCFEASTGSPPRGLQITLGIKRKHVIVDTIVMANLGYFQLKANPGAWILKLRQGRSADIYDIVSHEGSDTPENSTDIKVLISSLQSLVLKLKVAKKPDKLEVDLLSDDEANSGIWNSITSSFTRTDEESEEKLNIFSLASGHLYERFLRIMMLSVLKQTKMPVKFWFLKNYLSPQVKDFLPYMAKVYGFEFELIQYKWPRWLHQQTEKQRIIWGYKILFLDVLFPLDVKKIIFVDADQVVRADMKELQLFDLGGAPYGYTPFCDSRREMDGFRFWNHGYWRNHLQGRRYHISALYVVDLKRFRRIAAGDRLRGQYQALSQDPNSLSNLDQDLPNNMIHQVAIKSLPQEWLWCETWCDDSSKQYAKTIDLCNNPLTKEAKLAAAIRILPEWRGYDDEIRRLQQKIDSGVLDSDPAENMETERTDVHSEL